METQLFNFSDWANSKVIYNSNTYVLNPYSKLDLQSLTQNDIECINGDCVYFKCPAKQKILSIQKTAHHNILENIINILTLNFSSEYNKATTKFYFIKGAFSNLEQLFVGYKDADVPVIEMYRKKIFGIELSGCQIHRIRCLLKERIFNGSLTYDHIYPPHGPLVRLNEKHVCVLADAIGNFYFWLRDLNKLFDKNHLAICKAAHFNPENPGLDDYLNFIEAYFTNNLYVTLQVAFEETRSFGNLKLEITDSNEFHFNYISNKIQKLTTSIDVTFRSTEPSTRSAFITPVYLKLKQILNKAILRLNASKDKTILKTAFNKDTAVYKLLKSLITEIEDFYGPFIEIKIIGTSTDIDKEAVNSLLYKNWSKDGGAIKSLYNSMKEGGEISKRTTYNNFKLAFSNKKLTTKIALNLSKSGAFYFFRQLKNEAKIDDMNIWIAVSNAFYFSVDKNYDITRLAFQKIPKDKVVIQRINTLVNSI